MGPDPRFKDEAERRVKLATEHYQEGRYADALRLYQAAYDIYPIPRTLFNVGLAREKNFDYEGCALAFQLYLPDAPDKDLAARAKENMLRCLERALIPIKVSSLPAGAAAYVDDGRARTLKGRTPLTELELAPGTYTLTLEMPGYVTQSQPLVVEAGKRPTLDFILERLSSLNIEADVQGAMVQIDDGAWELAPMKRELPAGVYHVRVRKEGHRETSRQIRVEAGQQVSLVLSLPLLPRRSVLEIDAEPRGTLRIDGKKRALPYSGSLGRGEYRVQVTAPGRVPFADTITLSGDADTQLHIDLTPSRSGTNRAVMLTLVGAAGTCLLVGGAFGLITLQEQGDFDERPTAMGADEGQRSAQRADVMFASATVLAASAAVFWWFTRPEPSRARTVKK